MILAMKSWWADLTSSLGCEGCITQGYNILNYRECRVTFKVLNSVKCTLGCGRVDSPYTTKGKYGKSKFFVYSLGRIRDVLFTGKYKWLRGYY